MDFKVTELPAAGETFTASRGPFTVEGHEEAKTSSAYLVSLPFWTSRETLKLFTELYLKAADEGPKDLLHTLITKHSPFEGADLAKEDEGDALEHWTLVPQGLQLLSSDEKLAELRAAAEKKRSVLFTYGSKNTEKDLVIAGRPHKVTERTVILKTPLKTRSYSLESIGFLAVVTGRSSYNGVPKLKVVTTEGSKELSIHLSGAVKW